MSVLQDLATGLSVGLLYGMIGIGFVIIHRMTGVVNFAQGDLAVAGAFGAVWAGRAMVSSPSIMLLDEPSLGLSPQLVARIMRALSQLRDEGLTIVLVEQNAAAALRLADRGYLISTGRVLAEGPCKVLAEDPLVRRVYLGGAPVRGADETPRLSGLGSEPAPIGATDHRRAT